MRICRLIEAFALKGLVCGLLAAVIVLAGPGTRLAAQEEKSFLRAGSPPGVSEITANQCYPRFTELVKKLSPAVVNISVESAGDDDSPDAPPVPNIPKHDPDLPYKSLGSGFIVQEDGFIVTNNHVIEKADKIVVRLLNDRKDYEAQVIGRDLKTDLALLKINPLEKLPVVFLGDSDQLEVGEWVVAIGNQFQLGHTVSAGIVSALSRKVRSPNGSPYDAYIQTDASINPGSSGGPLFNVKGQVIGIATAIFTPNRSPFGGTGFNIGIGFAIPINLVKSIVTQLHERGKVTRGLLGVIIQPIDKELQEALGLASAEGALVADVMDNTPASAAGFKIKDVIVSFDGKKVRDYDDLPIQVAETKIGKTVNIEVIRDGKVKSLPTTITELKESAPQAQETVQKGDKLGLVVGDLPPDTAGQRKKGQGGVLVLSVEPGSLASRTGIEQGDVIEELGGKRINDTPAYEQVRDALDLKKPVLVLLRKREGTRFLLMRPKVR